MDFWAAATSRARDLASLDLDAMAADDDYIHTLELNVAKPTTSTVELAPGMGATLSSAVAPFALLDRRPTSAKSSTQRAEEASARLNALVFHDDAPKSHVTEDHGKDDSDDEDLSDADDPILSLLRGSSHAGETHRSTPSRPPSDRFLSDLEQRTAQAAPLIPEEEEKVPVAPKLWPWSARSTEEAAGSRLSLGPLWGRPKKERPPPQDDPEHFTTVSSGHLVMDEEERRALASLRKQSTRSSDSWCDRETFVLATFLLGAAVYFYSKMSAADDAGL
jgi:hypothetical protein